MSLETKYRHLSSNSLRERILRRDAYSDETAFYLLRYRMLGRLSSIYRQYNIKEDLGDVIMDFYLHLRDSKRGSDHRPYHAIEGLRSWFAFESWILKSFKNFLLRKLELEARTAMANSSAGVVTEGYNSHVDEQIYFMGQIIGWTDMNISSQDRFIFYRSLLTSLNKDKTIERDRMAEALGLTGTNYRTRDSRTRGRILSKLNSIQNGEPANLDVTHESLAKDIVDNYENFFQIIARLYESTLKELNAYEAVKALRLKDLEEQRKKEQSSDDGVRYSVRSSNSDIRYSTRVERRDDFSMLSFDLQKPIRLSDTSFQTTPIFGSQPKPKPTHRFTVKPKPAPPVLPDFSDLNKKDELFCNVKKFLSGTF